MEPIILHQSITSQVLTSWDISPKYIPQLERYYILHWSGEYFSNLYYNSFARFDHQGITYTMIFYKGLVNETLAASKVALSFRKTYGLAMGYVLVKPIQEIVR